MGVNILDIFTIGSKIIDRLFPDPQKKAEAQLELVKLEQAGAFKEMDNQLQRDLAQADINKAEAASGNAFAASWRPLCGYVCVLGLAYQFLLQPLLAWGSGIWAVPLPPNLDLGDLLTILDGMLGLGSLRTAEKFKGVAR